MTNTHTPGRLQVPEPYDGQYGVIVENDCGRYAVAVSIRNPADARRLAACWNVCQGFDTEVLESILCVGDTMLTRFQARTRVEETLIADRLKAIQERDRLQTALRETWSVLDQAGLEHLSNGVQLGQTAWYVKAIDVRTLSMKALWAETPAQQPPPTPSEPEFCPGNLPKCKWVATEPCGSKCTTCGDTVPF